MSDEISLAATTVNAPDALELARFYAEITRGVAKGSAHWAVVDGPNGSLGFQQVDDFRPPAWPRGDPPMQMHLEFFVDDLDATRHASSRQAPDPSTSSRTPITASSTPTRSDTPSAYPPGKPQSWPTTSPRRTDETAAVKTPPFSRHSGPGATLAG